MKQDILKYESKVWQTVREQYTQDDELKKFRILKWL